MENLVKILTDFFKTTDNLSNLDNDQRNSAIAIKLDLLYKLLDLSPYDDQGVFHQSRYKQVKKEIEPAMLFLLHLCSVKLNLAKVGASI